MLEPKVQWPSEERWLALKAPKGRAQLKKQEALGENKALSSETVEIQRPSLQTLPPCSARHLKKVGTLHCEGGTRIRLLQTITPNGGITLSIA